MVMIMYGLVFFSTAMIVYYFSSKVMLEGVSLPEGFKESGEQQISPPKEILDFTARFTNRFIDRADTNLMEVVKRRLIFAGKPITLPQFVAFKFLAIICVPAAAIILFKPELPFVLVAAVVGFLIPDFWLNGRIAKRRQEALRDLPYIIDLLNICVSAGLDFMVAINHVIKEFRPCIVVDEFKTMVKEMQMGLARRDALKNVAKRIASPEINSFVRTLLQADRMGTPITNALKMHAEELRMVRFQKGEEMALKAPIKLLIPLLLFILPVVLVIVAGPILIQFTQGGGIKF